MKGERPFLVEELRSPPPRLESRVFGPRQTSGAAGATGDNDDGNGGARRSDRKPGAEKFLCGVRPFGGSDDGDPSDDDDDSSGEG
eukprot:3048908-Heterocapsa_arctica.AAC.1